MQNAENGNAGAVLGWVGRSSILGACGGGRLHQLIVTITHRAWRRCARWKTSWASTTTSIARIKPAAEDSKLVETSLLICAHRRLTIQICSYDDYKVCWVEHILDAPWRATYTIDPDRRQAAGGSRLILISSGAKRTSGRARVENAALTVAPFCCWRERRTQKTIRRRGRR